MTSRLCMIGHCVAWLALVGTGVGTGCGACGSRRGGEQVGTGSAKVGGDVVSTVDGVAITVSEVQHLVDESDLSPRQALARLQTELLLMREAEARGYAAGVEVRAVSRQAAAQAVLASDVESLHASDVEIAQAYAAQKARFHLPEKRRSVHVLASLPAQAGTEQDNAARAFVEEACKAFQETSDLEETLRSLSMRTSEHFQVRVERLPLVANDGAFVPEFMKGLFSPSERGPVREPVRTSFGWHAIYVTEIQPQIDTDLAAARPILAREIETELRKHKLEELLKRLRSENPLVYDAKGQKALASFDL